MSNASEAFDAHAYEYDKWFETSEGSALFASEIDAILPHTIILEHPFLEIGVGTGRFARELQIDEGIDPSEQALTIARKHGVKTQKATGEDIPFADALFGAVFILFTLCFVEIPEKVLLEAARVVKPGGCVLVGIINGDSAWGRLYMQKQAEGHSIYRYARFYNAAEILAMLKGAGLHIEAATSTLFQPPSINPYKEKASPGLSEEAGFICIRTRKVSGEMND